jgi:2-polyprenyl-6-methoxyphenol hydroxylase-like FAD-dependent oxidoreductase
MPSFIGKQALVVGAGIGGLAAARALADYFERVVVLERDTLPAHAEPRAGVPQDKHPHVKRWRQTWLLTPQGVER